MVMLGGPVTNGVFLHFETESFLEPRRWSRSWVRRLAEPMPVGNAIELPSGTATFLFTDIQGSTQLVQKLGIERWREILDTHYRILRQEFAAHDGILRRSAGEVASSPDGTTVATSPGSDAIGSRPVLGGRRVAALPSLRLIVVLAVLIDSGGRARSHEEQRVGLLGMPGR